MSVQQIIKAGDPRRDKPSTWTTDFVPHPSFDAEDFQKRIDRAAGLSRGNSIIKLVWGGDAKKRIFTKWEYLAAPVDYKDVPEFAFHRKAKNSVRAEKIPIRRWFLTERHEPEQYAADNDADAYFSDGSGYSKQLREKPREGFYTPLLLIADHSKCPQNCGAEAVCLGDYKDPSEEEILWLKKGAAWIKDNAVIFNPRKAMNAQNTQMVLEHHERRILALDEALLEAEMMQYEMEMRDWWRTHGNRLWFS